jgi:hypothetical protein
MRLSVGKWLAYASDESARDEIYVRPFPGHRGKFPISSHGGREPRWSRDGREVYHGEPDSPYGFKPRPRSAQISPSRCSSSARRWRKYHTTWRRTRSAFL